LDVCLEEESKKGRRMNKMEKERGDEERNYVHVNKLIKKEGKRKRKQEERSKQANKQTNKSTTDKIKETKKEKGSK
jgi:hypothetical protein